MELTIKVNPTERTVRFREVHALAAGDAYSSVTLTGVAGAQTAALQLKLYRDSSASGVLAQCSSFSDVPGHPSVRRGAITFATQALKTWYEEIVDDATVTDANGMPSALVNAWLVISDSVKTWAACQVPLILRAMDTNVVQGADGISPTVSLSKSGSVLTISITDVNGTHVETVSDGQDGAPGVSPTVVVDVNPATGNVRVTAVNADGSTTTREVDVSGKAEKSEMSVTAGSDATKKTVQLKSGLSQEVLVRHQDVSGKAEKSEMSVTAGSDATKKTVQLKSGLSQEVLVAHQDVSGKAEKSEMSVTPGSGADADKTTIQLKSGTSATVLTAHQDISGKVTANAAITGATKCKVTFDSKGLVTGGADLADSDIPSLPASKIGSGTFDAARLPVATTSALGAVKPDGTTITVNNGVISAALPYYLFVSATVTQDGPWAFSDDDAAYEVAETESGDTWSYALSIGGSVVDSQSFAERQTSVEFSFIPPGEVLAVTVTATRTGLLTITPRTVATYTAGTSAAAFMVAVGTGVVGAARDCVLVVDCTATGAVAPTVTWPSNFHPRGDAEEIAPVAGVRNVFYISEYATGEFVVGGWHEEVGT